MAETIPTGRRRRKVNWGNASVSSAFDKASQTIANGADPFHTVFETSSDHIGTLTLTHEGKPVKTHDTSGRIPDERTMRAVIADLKTLGIAPNQSKKPITDQDTEKPTE